MSIAVNGNQTDYSFTRDGNSLLVVNNANSQIVAQGDSSFTVVFSDGTVDLSQTFNTLAATSPTTSFGSPSSTALVGGGYVLTWEFYNSDGSEEGIVLQQYDVSGALLKESKLPSYEAEDPSVTAKADGGYIVSWSDSKASTSSILFQQYSAAGIATGKTQTVTSSKSAELDDAVIAVLPGGKFVVTWLAQTEDESNGNWTQTGDLFSQLYNANGTKVGSAQKINGTTVEGTVAEDQNVLLTDSGFVVTYVKEWSTTDVNGTVYHSALEVRSFNANGLPTAAPKELTSLGSQTQNASHPSLLATDDGYLMTWVATNPSPGSGRSLFAQKLDAAFNTVGSELALTPGSNSNPNDSSLTQLSDGQFVAVWTADAGIAGNSVYVQIYTEGLAKVGDRILVKAAAGTYEPNVTALDNGEFLVNWVANTFTQQTQSADMFSQRYDAQGHLIGNTSPVISGDDDANSLTWTGAGAVTLQGLGGDDTLVGGAGDDTLEGGAGNDVLDGQGGSNLLIGGAGDDTYVVRSVNDQVVEAGDGGDDTVQSSITWTLGANLENLLLTGAAAINGTGNALNNVLNGNDAKNTLNGGDGDDFLAGAGGADTLIGGNGNDTFYVDLVLKGSGAKAVVALEDTVVEAVNGGANDTLLLRGIFNTAATTTLTLGANLETLDASLTGNTRLNLNGNALANTLIGNDASNVLSGGAGIDTLVGGKGDDTYVIDNLAELSNVNNLDGVIAADDGKDTLRIALKGGTASNPVTISLDAYANLVDVENVQLAGTGVYAVVGNDLDNRLDAGKATATLSGGQGNDTYVLTSKATQVIENADGGTDTIEASFTADLNNYANVENLTLTGKAALNATGTSAANVLTGNDGANILDGGTGADTLIGGKGNDTYIVDNSGDTVIEEAGGGVDTIKSSVHFNLGTTPYVENLTLTGSDDLIGMGNALANTLTGNSGKNVLVGGAGADKLIGGADDDLYIVDMVVKGTGSKATLVLEDTIVEKKGEGDHDALILQVSNDAQAKVATAKATTFTLANYLENVDASNTGLVKLNLTGNAADNVIFGNHAGNTLNGGAGNDRIVGGSGDDLIIGGVGADTLTGGGGVDTFSFTSLKDLGLGDSQDVITDFVSGTDKLDFKALKGWSFSGVVGDDHQATGTKQLWAVVENGDTIVYGNSGGSSDADFSIKLAGVTSLVSGDFVLA